MPSPLTTCPNCGKELHYAPQADANVAPWLCDECDRAWWPSELLPKYRGNWNPLYRDFGTKQGEVHALAKQDRDAAVETKRAKEKVK